MLPRSHALSPLWLAAVALLLAPAAAAVADDLPELRVPSRATGPPLWRVSRGDHELLLFGTLSAVPKDSKWSSAAVDQAIARSQEVLGPPGLRATPSLKPVSLVRLWRRVRELSANPGGKTLAQVLPREDYRRYSVLRDRYVRRDRSLETQRPIIAAGRVYEGAFEQMGLVAGREIDGGIERAARRADVEITDTKLHGDPEVLLNEAAGTTVAAELDCFDKVLGTVESDDGQLAARARAWAAGDVGALRRFEYPDIRRACLVVPGWPPGLLKVINEADDRWLAAAERALRANATTFGTLDLRDLLAADGLLARLRERGYDVKAP